MVIGYSRPRRPTHLAYVKISPCACPDTTCKEFQLEKLFPCSGKLQIILFRRQKLTVLGMAEVLEGSSREITELAIWPVRKDLTGLQCPGETTLVQSYVLRFTDPETFILLDCLEQNTFFRDKLQRIIN